MCTWVHTLISMFGIVFKCKVKDREGGDIAGVGLVYGGEEGEMRWRNGEE